MVVTVKYIKSGVDKKYFGLYDKFIGFLQQEFPLKHDVTVNFVSERIGHMSTSCSHTNNELYILTKGRINRDILRTLAHEWVHEYQRTILKYDKGPDIGGKNEDMANAEAGSLMKKFEKKYPSLEERMYD